MTLGNILCLLLCDVIFLLPSFFLFVFIMFTFYVFLIVFCLFALSFIICLSSTTLLLYCVFLHLLSSCFDFNFVLLLFGLAFWLTVFLLSKLLQLFLLKHFVNSVFSGAILIPLLSLLLIIHTQLDNYTDVSTQEYTKCACDSQMDRQIDQMNVTNCLP